MYAAVDKRSKKIMFTGKNREELEKRAKKAGIPFLIVDQSEFRNYDRVEVASNRKNWSTR